MGCAKRADKEALLRFVWHEGELKISLGGVGRGGYLHKSTECWEALIHRKNLYRTFHARVEREQREKFVQTLRGQR
ncbi:MAG: DUF448 domain-containing protein [Candidatus Binatia bacterium]